jgi:hypothetical protein
MSLREVAYRAGRQVRPCGVESPNDGGWTAGGERRWVGRFLFMMVAVFVSDIGAPVRGAFAERTLLPPLRLRLT